MNETTEMLLDAARRVFERNFDEAACRRAEEGEWLADGWSAIEEFGAPLALLSEEDGGFGLAAADAFALIRLAAGAAVPMPIGETMLANWLLAKAGLALAGGPLTVAPVEPGDSLRLVREGDGWRLTGVARNIPWGGTAGIVAVATAEDGDRLVLVEPGQASATAGRNMANHPRDTIAFDLAVTDDKVAALPAGLDAQGLLAAGAALRAAAIAGALERVLTLTVDYANERVQFGRPIGKFQAVQQNLARLAGEVAAASGAAALAAEGFDKDLAPLPIAVAKARTGEAAGIGASIAHQVIGAIGFTREHALNTLTRPLWSWRDEFGREAFWNERVGQAALASGPRGLWPFLTQI